MALPVQSAVYDPPPDEKAWLERARVFRPSRGNQEWLHFMAQRLKDRWIEASGAPPEHLQTHPGRIRAQSSRASSRDDEDPEAVPAPGLWTKRLVQDARRWVQTLDMHPAFGDSRFLWYVLGRPVMVRHPARPDQCQTPPHQTVDSSGGAH